MYTTTEIITCLVVTLVIFIALFLALRELNCWYWKVNERLRLQKEILFYLKKLVPPGETEEKGNGGDSSGIAG